MPPDLPPDASEPWSDRPSPHRQLSRWPLSRRPLSRRPLSRRRLMALAALAAAAPLGAVALPGHAATGRSGADGRAAGGGKPGGGVPKPPDGSADEAYQRAFEAALAEDGRVRLYRERGREFLYRPRQVLVADADAARVLARLREHGHKVTIGGRFAGVTRLVFDREVDVPAIVTWLRDPGRDQPVPAVQPHHVLVGFGNVMGNPGSPPAAAGALPPPDATRLKEGAGVTIGVCDTGISPDAAAAHPVWLGGSYVPEPDDEDAVFAYADVLALQGGHGTFVAGVARQAAPGVRVDPERALDAVGVGDEEMLVDAIGRLAGVHIVNLSLGCFTQDDVPPLPLANALDALPADVAVVASAGNSGGSRPSWPAALGRVVAVAAVSDSGGGPQPAPYSNFGSWVDACAVGERVSTYVTGRLVLPGVPDEVFGDFASWAGTSFAAPHVAGRLAALMTDAGVDAATAAQMMLAAPRWHPDYGVLVG